MPLVLTWLRVNINKHKTVTCSYNRWSTLFFAQAVTNTSDRVFLVLPHVRKLLLLLIEHSYILPAVTFIYNRFVTAGHWGRLSLCSLALCLSHLCLCCIFCPVYLFFLFFISSSTTELKTARRLCTHVCLFICLFVYLEGSPLALP